MLKGKVESGYAERVHPLEKIVGKVVFVLFEGNYYSSRPLYPMF